MVKAVIKIEFFISFMTIVIHTTARPLSYRHPQPPDAVVRAIWYIVIVLNTMGNIFFIGKNIVGCLIFACVIAYYIRKVRQSALFLVV